MDRNKRITWAIIIIFVIVSIIYTVFSIFRDVDPDLPFFTLFPSWFIIYIAIRVQNKKEERMELEQLKKHKEESNNKNVIQ